MKAENLMVQSAPAAKGAGANLRSAVQAKTAAQSAKADKNDFGSALDNAKNAQKSGHTETKDAPRAEVKEAPKPDASDAKQSEAENVAKTKDADVRSSETEGADAGTSDANGAETASAVEEAAEAAKDLPKTQKKDKTGKSDDAKDVKSDDAAEAEPTTREAATTLNAMLMAMAGEAQANAAQTGAEQAKVETTDGLQIQPTVAEPQIEAAAPTFATGSLDALLPQDAAKEQQAAQNQQLMDMLSGNGAEMRLTDEQIASLSSKPQEAAANSAAELTEQAVLNEETMVTQPQAVKNQPVLDEAQLSPQAQTTEPVIKTGEAVLEQPETAAVLQDASAQTQLRPVAQENRAETRGGKPESLFAGVPLTVEDVVLDKVQTDVRQNLADMPGRQPQQHPQGQTDEATPEVTRVSGGKELDGAREARQSVSESPTGAQQTQANGAGAIPQGMSFSETLSAAGNVEAAPVQQPQDPYNVMRQIVDQARLIRSDANTEMVIRLNPEHLGELTLRVAVTASGAINATFHTENAQVRGLLESSMIQLKQELQQQGLKVNNVDVQSGLSQDFFAQSQAGQQGYPQSQHFARNQAADRRAFENDADTLTINAAVEGAAAADPAANTDASDGVNYLV